MSEAGRPRWRCCRLAGIVYLPIGSLGGLPRHARVMRPACPGIRAAPANPGSTVTCRRSYHSICSDQLSCFKGFKYFRVSASDPLRLLIFLIILYGLPAIPRYGRVIRRGYHVWGIEDANLLEGMEHEEAARLAGLSRSAAYEWHNRYEEDGFEGLRDRPRPGRQPRVDAVTSARFKERIVAGVELERDGVVAFRAVDAQRILKEEFEIDCSLSSTYRLLHRIQLSWLAPRPRHPQADATAQAAFSQLSDYN